MMDVDIDYWLDMEFSFFEFKFNVFILGYFISLFYFYEKCN